MLTKLIQRLRWKAVLPEGNVSLQLAIALGYIVRGSLHTSVHDDHHGLLRKYSTEPASAIPSGHTANGRKWLSRSEHRLAPEPTVGQPGLSRIGRRGTLLTQVGQVARIYGTN